MAKKGITSMAAYGWGPASSNPVAPTPPDRRAIAVAHAMKSDNPLVLEATDRLVVAAELAHSEEIAAEFNVKEMEFQRALRLYRAAEEERQQRIRANQIELEIAMERKRTRDADFARRLVEDEDRRRRDQAARERMREAQSQGFLRWLFS